MDTPEYTIEDAIAYLCHRKAWREAYRLAKNTPAQWAIIREVYAAQMPLILQRSQAYLRGRIDPYVVDWTFTPIEEPAWHTIRALGTPLYPQVPVDRFFLDFANPYCRIGLELDGADFHNVEEDTKRDEVLAQQGWRIFRITGVEAWASAHLPDEWEDLDLAQEELGGIRRWMMTTGDGVITALDLVYFRPHPEDSPRYGMALDTLDAHRLVDFPLTQGDM